MRLLLIGASGYFGRHFAPLAEQSFEVFSAHYTHPERITAGQPVSLDLKDEAAVRSALAELQPQIVVNAAASNRDEQNLQSIVPGARVVAEYARQTEAHLIHFSSDLVFGGGQAPYADDARPCPIAAYGQLKAEAAAIVGEACPAALIVRPSLIYGFDPPDTQLSWLLEGMRRGDTVRLFTDEMRCPVWVRDLCAAVLELCGATEIAGPMNLGGPQPISRWDFGMKMLGGLGVTPGPNVIPATVAESGMVRARDVTMRSERAGRLLETRLRSVDEVIDLRTDRQE